MPCVLCRMSWIRRQSCKMVGSCEHCPDLYQGLCTLTVLTQLTHT